MSDERKEHRCKKGRNMILIPSNGDRHKSRSPCLAGVAGQIKGEQEDHPVEGRRGEEG